MKWVPQVPRILERAIADTETDRSRPRSVPVQTGFRPAISLSSSARAQSSMHAMTPALEPHGRKRRLRLEHSADRWTRYPGLLGERDGFFAPTEGRAFLLRNIHRSPRKGDAKGPFI